MIHAFPSLDERDAWGNGIREGSPGMTLRDYFASQAFSGFCSFADEPLEISGGASEKKCADALREFWRHRARAAYIAADAMMSERDCPI